MIIISLLGMDHYNAIEVTKKLHDGLVSIYGCDDDELLFFAPESFLIHNGIEQTSFMLHIKVEAPEDYIDKEEEVKNFLSNSLTETAIHFHISFQYFAPEHEYLVTNEDYPLYMTDNNTVKATLNKEDYEEEQAFEEEYEEPYMGEIMEEFDRYIKEHPNASNDEVYQKISEIREVVTMKHHADHKEEEHHHDHHCDCK